MRGCWGIGVSVLITAASGCASQTITPSAVKPTLAVFPVESKRLKLKPDELAALQEHATAIMATSETFDVVPYKRVVRKLRRRRPAERTCHRRSCQVKIGRRVLKVGMSQATLVSRNMLNQCDVFAFLHDLGQEVTAQSGRHRAAGCDLEQLARAVGRVTCHIIQMRRRELKQATEPEEAELVIGTTASEAPGKARPGRDCLARAAILWLERKQEAFTAARPGRSRKAKQSWTQQLAGRVMDLKRDYDQVARYPSPVWSAVAVCRTGRLYERLADKTLALYGKQHHQAAQQQAGPFRQQAIQIYEACLAQVKKKALAGDNPFFEEARQRLQALKAAASAQ